MEQANEQLQRKFSNAESQTWDVLSRLRKIMNFLEILDYQGVGIINGQLMRKKCVQKQGWADGRMASYKSSVCSDLLKNFHKSLKLQKLPVNKYMLKVKTMEHILTYFTPFSIFSIIDLEQVHTCLVNIK